MIKEANEIEVLNDLKNGLVLVDFYSSTCGPCKMLSFILDEVDKSYADELKIYKIDYNKYQEMADEYDVKTYPTMVIFWNGEERGRLEGLKEKSEILELINKCKN